MDGEVETLAPGGGGGGRAEIDTSAPFESVREAVDRFGGSAAWSSQLIKRMFAPEKHDQFEEVEQAMNVEEQTAQLEKELIIKERETLDVLKELESTKRIIADLKLKLRKEATDASLLAVETDKIEVTALAELEGQCLGNLVTDVDMENPDEHVNQRPSSVLIELKQAKANLHRTTSNLAEIRAAVELLSNSTAKEKMLLERCRENLSSNTALVSSLKDELDQTTQKLQILKDLQTRREDPSDIFIEIKNMTSEIEQLRNMTNASKSEAMMLAAEIEQTRASIGTAEVRCLAAKKMEAAARAAEALALAEIKALLSSEASAADNQGFDGVTLSLEEYFMLASKAQEADESSRRKLEDAMLQVDEANHSKSDSLRKLEEAKAEVEQCKKALEDALKRVDAANRGKHAVDEALRRWRAEHVHKRRSYVHGSPKFKNAGPHRRDSRNMGLTADDSKSSLKPTMSIGQILSMKLMGPEGYDKRVWETENEVPNVSLGQILNRNHGILCPADVAARKQFSGKRKKFAFAGLSGLLAKQNKSKKKRQSNSS